MVSNSELQLLVSSAQALFALGLLVATGFYTYYTRQQSRATRDQIDAMNAQVKASTMPYLKTTIERPNFAECYFAIQNTGNGAAHDVTATWSIGDGRETRRWNIPLLPAGQKRRFIITKADDDVPATVPQKIEDALGGRAFDLHFQADCKDIFDNEAHFEETIDLEHAIWEREENSYELPKKPPEETISEGVSSLSDSLGDVGDLASFLKPKLPGIIEAREFEQYLRHLRDYGEMSVEQLAKLSAEKKYPLKSKLRRLSEEGLIELDEENDRVRLVAEDEKTED